ncbi:MAG: hypothetical protein FWG63_01720 [Defluviitaleaceae bacterium]|nr:hypothetical protein [Defluviitaleaceae bacterium]
MRKTMRAMLRKLLITTLVVSFIALPIYWFFRPIPILEPGSDGVITRIIYPVIEPGTYRFVDVDVTEILDIDEVAHILSRYYTRRTFNNPFPHLIADIRWEITIHRGRGQLFNTHITLGVNNILYHSADDRIMHTVLNAQTLIYELDNLLLNSRYCPQHKTTRKRA